MKVAMAWTRQMVKDCYPILGGTSIEHLKENIEASPLLADEITLTRLKALKIRFTDAQMKKLSEASPVSHGFPTAAFGLDPRALEGGSPNAPLLTAVSVSNDGTGKSC